MQFNWKQDSTVCRVLSTVLILCYYSRRTIDFDQDKTILQVLCRNWQWSRMLRNHVDSVSHSPWLCNSLVLTTQIRYDKKSCMKMKCQLINGVSLDHDCFVFTAYYCNLKTLVENSAVSSLEVVSTRRITVCSAHILCDSKSSSRNIAKIIIKKKK
jgi:hypothetical protein